MSELNFRKYIKPVFLWSCSVFLIVKTNNLKYTMKTVLEIKAEHFITCSMVMFTILCSFEVFKSYVICVSRWFTSVCIRVQLFRSNRSLYFTLSNDIDLLNMFLMQMLSLYIKKDLNILTINTLVLT